MLQRLDALARQLRDDPVPAARPPDPGDGDLQCPRQPDAVLADRIHEIPWAQHHGTAVADAGPGVSGGYPHKAIRTVEQCWNCGLLEIRLTLDGLARDGTAHPPLRYQWPAGDGEPLE